MDYLIGKWGEIKMSGTYPLLAAFLFIANATKKEEREDYHNIMGNLDDIVRNGIDLTVWNVNTNVSGLPESRNFLWLSEHYKKPNESSYNYLWRVFETIPSYRVRFDELSVFSPFAFYEDADGHLIAKRKSIFFNGMLVPPLTGECRKNFSLVFALSKPEIEAQKSEVTLFMPIHTDMPEIVRELEVRQHVSQVNYSEFLKKDPQLDDKKRIYGVYHVRFDG